MPTIRRSVPTNNTTFTTAVTVPDAQRLRTLTRAAADWLPAAL